MSNNNDAWERLRHMTLDQVITEAKLRGSGVLLWGWTTPEHWPFALTVAIGSPGNEAVVEFTKGYHRILAKACRWTATSHNPAVPEDDHLKTP